MWLCKVVCGFVRFCVVVCGCVWFSVVCGWMGCVVERGSWLDVVGCCWF